MASVRVVLHRSEFDALLTSPNGGVVRDLMARGRRVENRAKQLCRVDTGRLRASITMQLLIVDDVPVVRIGTNVEYAPYLEYGTRRAQAHPFLNPALDAAR